MTKPTYDTIRIAQAFAAALLKEIGEDDFKETRRRNQEDPDYRDGACASHDFCDANVVMAEVFMDLYQVDDVDDADLTNAWNAAWEYARTSGLIQGL